MEALLAVVARHRALVYAYTVCVSAAVLVLACTWLALPIVQEPWHVLLVLGLCAVADIPLIDTRFGHNLESFTFVEIVLVIGLFLVPTSLLVVMIATCVLLLHLVRRIALLKAFFNASCSALGAGLAGLTYTLFGGGVGAQMSWSTAFALAAATIVFFVWNSVATAAVVAWSQGMLVWAVYRQGAGMRILVCVSNSIAGILLLALASWSTQTLWVLPPLLLLMYMAYRGYLRAMQERDVWRQLEQATRELNSLDERGMAAAALGRAKQLFRPDSVELLVAVRADGPARLYSVDEDGALVLAEVGRQRGSFGATTYVQLDGHGDVDPPVTCLSAPLEGPQGHVGALRLLFGGPVRLRGRERQVLSTFSHAVATALLNAALYDDVRTEAARKAHEASHDHLTGLGNRSLLIEGQKAAIASADGTTALLLLDLDHFKEINDTLGHAAGDVLLQQVGHRLQSFAGDTHLVARLGGDEFAVLLTGLPTPEAAEPVAEALLGLLSAPVEFEGLRLSVEASLGVACHPQDAATSEELFRRADVAMYQAKSTRGRWLRYDSERDDSSVHRQALVAELRAALELDQLVMHYQPQADLQTGVIVGAEALCRWQHPTRGLLPPSEFIGVAEHSGLIRPFTLRVLDRAVAQCATWQDQAGPVSVAVNLSARSLLDRQLPHDVRAVLARHGLPPGLLVLEITETTATSELEVVEDVLAGLRRLGVQVSVDDFGTGYSSLAFLQRTAVHELKVDRTFVAGMLASENDLALVRATVQLARSLGARSVAEGVEDANQVTALRQMGCDVAQGYWLSKPLSDSGLRNLLGLRGTPGLRPGGVPAPRTAQLRVLRSVLAEGA